MGEVNCRNCYVGAFKEDLCEGEFCEKYKAKGNGDDFIQHCMKPEWVPCSESLPEDDELMLVTYIDHSCEGGTSLWIGWHEMENVWYIDGDAHSREYGNEVIAWMPLPKMYEDGEQE